MTQELFDRVVELSNRLIDLNTVKERIEDRHEHKLTYSYKGLDGKFERVDNQYTMSLIGELLDRHDLAIRKEIDDEIEQIHKTIEAL